MEVDLPCNVSIPPGDYVNAIFWYHGSSGIPLCSLDARTGGRGRGRGPERGAAPTLLLPNASATMQRDYPCRVDPMQPAPANRRVVVRGAPPPLRLVNASAAMDGDYRCRVDFREAPTANRRVVLRVAEPPQHPVILDAQGKEVIGNAGPFYEGFEMELQCLVAGGRPPPKVEWWLNGSLRDAIVDAQPTGAAVNRLLVKTVSRQLLGARLECRTYSSPLAAPLAAPLVHHVPFDLILKPQSVQLLSPGGQLLPAGMAHRFVCEVWGSAPAARVTWFLDGRSLHGHDQSDVATTNATSSTVSLVLGPQDDGRELSCRAHNDRIPAVMLYDKRMLRVTYPPQAAVVLRVQNASDGQAVAAVGAAAVEGAAAGRGAVADAEAAWGDSLGPAVRLGDQASLHCEVRAQPPPTHIVWFHKGVPLGAEAQAGSGGSGADLLLGPVRPHHAGDYECAATNREGEARSAPLRLRVHYAPRCVTGGERRRVGALPGQNVTAKCAVDAAPAGDDLRFLWTEDREEGGGAHARNRVTKLVPAARVASTGSASFVSVAAPAVDAEPVVLLCYATNSVGEQQEPCEVAVVLARTPQPPSECVVHAVPTGALEVRCSPGDDGDLTQHFELEAQEVVEAGGSTARGAFLYHHQSAEPSFELEGLVAGRAYQLAVYATNAKGRSAPVLLGVVRPPPTRPQPPANPPPAGVQPHVGAQPREQTHGDAPGGGASAGESVGPLQPTPIILAVVIGAAVLLLSCMLVTAALLACRRRRPGLPPLPPLPPPLPPLMPQPSSVDANDSGAKARMADEELR